MIDNTKTIEELKEMSKRLAGNINESVLEIDKLISKETNQEKKQQLESIKKQTLDVFNKRDIKDVNSLINELKNFSYAG